MATTAKWSAVPTDRSNRLTTELNSLASGATCSTSAAYDNTTNRDQLAIFEANVTFASTPADGGYLAVYCIPSLDATNYATLTDGHLVCCIPVSTAGTAQRLVSETVLILPANMKFVLVNNTDQNMAASGNTLKLWTIKEGLE